MKKKLNFLLDILLVLPIVGMCSLVVILILITLYSLFAALI